jgi:hypothetical protein
VAVWGRVPRMAGGAVHERFGPARKRHSTSYSGYPNADVRCGSRVAKAEVVVRGLIADSFLVAIGLFSDAAMANALICLPATASRQRRKLCLSP